MTRERVLITGPGGRIGPHLLPYLRKEFALRLFDLQPLDGREDDEVVQGDIRNFEQLLQACQGVTSMIHLAAISDEADFPSKLLPVNLAGGYHALEAARQAGLRRVIYASTCQTILNYGEGHWVTPEMPVRPRTIYACTKVFGEALGRYYSDQHGLSVICLRIAWFQGYDSLALRQHRELASHWCSPADLAQLMIKSLRSQVQFAVFFGVSNNRGRFWDISNAQELIGYAPVDDGGRLWETRS